MGGALVRQAGAIAVRFDREEPEFLLVTARANAAQWIFPKGHIEPSETPESAARRELREEAGVDGRTRGCVGTLRFRSGAESVEVTYFLCEADAAAEGEAGEGREKAWLRFSDARRRLSFDDTRALLSRARHLLEENP